MLPVFPHPMMGRTQKVASYVQGQAQNGLTSYTYSLAGLAADDLVIVYSSFSSITSVSNSFARVGSAYTWPTLGYTDDVFAKAITLADVGTTLTVTVGNSGGFVIFLVYRGPTAVTWKTSVETGGVYTTATGFSKAGAHLGAVCLGSDRSIGSMVVQSPATPRFSSVSSSFFSGGAGDILNGAYTNNAGIDIGGAVTGTKRVAHLLELTG